MGADRVEQVVLAAVRELVERAGSGRTVELQHRLAGDLRLASLDLAELVAILELELAVDPFAAGASIADIRTVGDLVGLYRKLTPT
jgi:hypothetical protein